MSDNISRDKKVEDERSLLGRRKRILVSGCYDLLHSGHVAFFEAAARFGDVYVQIGNDKNIHDLKGRPPMFPESERLYMVSAIKYVKEASISKGMGMLDWEADIPRIRPDALYVNEDGDRQSKADICKKYGLEYIVDRRKPKDGLNARSSTALKKMLKSGSAAAGTEAGSESELRLVCKKGSAKDIFDARILSCVAHAASLSCRRVLFDSKESAVSNAMSEEDSSTLFRTFPIVERGDVSLTSFLAQIEFISECGAEDLTGQNVAERALLRHLAETVRNARDSMYAALSDVLDVLTFDGGKLVARPVLEKNRTMRIYQETVRTARALEGTLRKRKGPFVIGMRPTYADYVIAVWLKSSSNFFGDPSVYSKLPRLRELYDAVLSLPRMSPFFNAKNEEEEAGD